VSVVVPFFAAQQPAGPPAFNPVQAGAALLPLLGAGRRGVLLQRSPRDVAAVPAHSRGDDACRHCVTLTLAPGPTAGAPGEKHGAVRGAQLRRARQQGNAYLLLHTPLSQHWQLSTPGDVALLALGMNGGIHVPGKQ